MEIIKPAAAIAIAELRYLSSSETPLWLCVVQSKALKACAQGVAWHRFQPVELTDEAAFIGVLHFGENLFDPGRMDRRHLRKSAASLVGELDHRRAPVVGVAV